MIIEIHKLSGSHSMCSVLKYRKTLQNDSVRLRFCFVVFFSIYEAMSSLLLLSWTWRNNFITNTL